MPDARNPPAPPMDNLGYLMAGVGQVATTSSVLVSSSRFLNSPILRDWIATHYLRANGPDRPTASDTAAGLIPALAELRDTGKIAELIDHEKQINPRFRQWVDARYISHMRLEDFAHFAPETVGGIYYRYQVDHGFALNLARDMIEPRDDYEFMRFRFGQIHDYEHILGGGGFNTLGEIVPYFLRLAALYKYLSPDLAVAFGDIHVLGGFRMPVRAGLNHPETFLTTLECIQRGSRIGMESEPVFMMRFEDVLGLTPAEARAQLGVRHAEDFDTAAMSAIFDNRGGA
jgi:ubiquinone biosynthesis protein COQ4